MSADPAPLAAVPERSPLAGHIHALDGVRGLAVLAVMLFHFVAHGPGFNAWPAWVRNIALAGWAGVDVFFVLSGFLITRILLNLRGRPRAMGVFYARRALRIFPLYYAVLFGVAVAAMLQSRQGFDGPQWLNFTAIALYLTNVNICVHGWGTAVFSQIQLTHLWTLAIEEQFYLLWPLVVLYLPRRVVACTTLGLIVLAPLLRVLLLKAGHESSVAYILTPCRMDTLAWGALVASAEAARPGQLSRFSFVLLVIGTLGVTTIAGVNKTIYEHAPAVQRFGFTALAIASAGGIGLCAAHALPTPIRRLLTARWLTALGRYSYAIYLFHLPLRGAATAAWRAAGYDYARLTLPQAMASNVLLIGMSIALAVASFYTFEQWFLRLKPIAPAPSH